MQIPSGFIVLWANSIGSIPAGWQLCDGSNGTPNLVDRFVPGAGGGFAVNEFGGAAVHEHPFTSDPHTHEIEAGAAIGAGAALDTTTSADAGSGTTNTASSLPPFHALAYIMKL